MDSPWDEDPETTQETSRAIKWIKSPPMYNTIFFRFKVVVHQVRASTVNTTKIRVWQ
jgi:hypothetical protein